MNLSEVKEGMAVKYHPIIGGPDNGKVYTVKCAGTMDNGHEVAWLDGRPSCVAVAALSMADDERPNNNLSGGR